MSSKNQSAQCPTSMNAINFQHDGTTYVMNVNRGTYTKMDVRLPLKCRLYCGCRSQ